MRRQIFLVLLLSLSQSSCANGPKVSACPSDPTNNQIDCSDAKGRKNTVPFSATLNYSFFPNASEQLLLNYCAERSQPGTAAPQFTACTSQPNNDGVECVIESCFVNAAQNGIVCQPNGQYFVPYQNTDGYVAFSQADTIALLGYCNITLQK